MMNILENQLEPFGEHLKAPSTIHDCTITGHLINMDNFSIIGWRDMALPGPGRVRQPNLNKNIGKYNIPHI